LVTGVGATSALAAGQNAQITDTATCATGKVVLGGGARITTSAAGDFFKVHLSQSYPSATNVWTALATVNTALGVGNTATITAYALCSP
jgi:hypothetical protein